MSHNEYRDVFSESSLKFIIYLDDLLCLGASDVVALPLERARRNKWSSH